jgi:hypothetical protein
MFGANHMIFRKDLGPEIRGLIWVGKDVAFDLMANDNGREYDKKNPKPFLIAFCREMLKQLMSEEEPKPLELVPRKQA